MGRAPCCDKANVKKGPWSPEEDEKLKAYIDQHGIGGNWIALPQKIGLKRCGKSCRLRWLNYLRPNIKHGGFSEEEDNIICSLFINIGSRWSIIAAQLPGRTDNDIKNYWNTRLKKKLLGKQRKQHQARRLKQEMKKESENYPVTGIMNQPPYWAEEQPLTMPISNSNHDDQVSIRNLLIKLGGRFDNNSQEITTNFHYPFDISFSQDQIYANSMNMISSSSSLNSMDGQCSQFPDTQFDFQDPELNELFYSNNPQELDEGMNNFYGMNGGSGTCNSSESSSWGEMNSLVYQPPCVNNFEGFQQEMFQGSTMEDLKYFRTQ